MRLNIYEGLGTAPDPRRGSIDICCHVTSLAQRQEICVQPGLVKIGGVQCTSMNTLEQMLKNFQLSQPSLCLTYALLSLCVCTKQRYSAEVFSLGALQPPRTYESIKEIVFHSFLESSMYQVQQIFCNLRKIINL